jgi:hypothetical protein
MGRSVASQSFFITFQTALSGAAHLAGTEFDSQFNTLVRDAERHFFLREINLSLGSSGNNKQWFIDKIWPDGTSVRLLDSGGNITADDVIISGDSAHTALAPGDKISITTSGTVADVAVRMYLMEI